MDLTTTSVYTKKAAIIIAVSMVLLLILRVIIEVITGVIHQIQANQPLKPTNGFGKLPALNIPSITLSSGQQPRFVLDTPTGTLPTFPSYLLVYPYAPTKLHLTSLENATQMAQSFSFTQPPTPIDKYNYQWADTFRTLDINIKTQNISLQANPSGLFQYLGTQGNGAFNLPGIDSRFRSALNTIRPLSQDYLNGTTNVIPLFVNQDGTVQNPTVQNPTNAAYINLFRSLQGLPQTTTIKATSLPVLGPNPHKGNINSLITQADSLQSRSAIFQMQVVDWPIASISSAQLYTIIPVSKAWQELTTYNSNAKLVYLAPKGVVPTYASTSLQVSSFNVLDISIAYYDSLTPQSYIQPIYVFQGVANLPNNALADFYAYVPAIQQ